MSKKPIHNVTAGVIYQHGKVIIKRRPPGSHHEGFWEFPGGKKESWESLSDCLKRELFEELGIDVRVEEHLYTLTHEYDHAVIILHFFRCTLLSEGIEPEAGSEIRWVHPEDLDEYDFLPPDRRFVRYFIKWRDQHDKGACAQNKELSQIL
jgi:mutator protein MutT